MGKLTDLKSSPSKKKIKGRRKDLSEEMRKQGLCSSMNEIPQFTKIYTSH